MSTSTSRARERTKTRERLIAAALHVLETEGITALPLLRDLVAHGHRRMLTEFREAAEEPDADRRMTRIAAEYVRFAGEHPHLYRVMNDPVVDGDERRRVVEPANDVLKEKLTGWSTAHNVVLADPDQACEILWGTLHGIASGGPQGRKGDRRGR